MFNIYTKLINSSRDTGLDYYRFSPFSTMLERMFDDTIYSASRSFLIEENDDAYSLTLELPGYKQSHLDITVAEDVMTIKANKDKASFERSFTLPSGVDVDKIEAKLEDGVLSVKLPKSLNSKPRKIAIK